MVTKSKIYSNKLIAVFIVLLIGYFIYKNITSSVFFKKTNRLNVVFYGDNTVVYSLGFEDVDYFLTFDSDTEILVPGGYGNYRIGALGKLVSLENKHDIIKKAFSSATSSFIDLYFYPGDSEIYYGNNKKKELPSLKQIFFDKSSGNLIDRLFLWSYIIKKNIDQYKYIDTDVAVKKEGAKALFDNNEFFKVYQGYFYNKTYRKDKYHVQVLYTKQYKTAQLLGNIVEGEGIQVVDLSQSDLLTNTCVIIYGKDSIEKSQTIYGLQRYFGCLVKKGEVDVSDIIISLGELEKEWNID